jgi:hypothetical protein
MPSLPLTLLSFHPCSHASCLPQLVVMLPVILRCLSFLSRNCLLSGGASTCPPLVAPPPLFIAPLLLWCTCLLSALAIGPVTSPQLPPPICLHLRLSLHHCLSSCPSHASCPAVCGIASHHANAAHPPAPPTLVHPSHVSRPLWLVVV